MYCVVLDYHPQKVDIFDIPSSIDPTNSEQIEEWLEDNYYNVDEIHYMVTDKIRVEINSNLFS